MCSSSILLLLGALALGAFTVCIFVLLRAAGCVVGAFFRGFGRLFGVKSDRPGDAPGGGRLPQICTGAHCRRVNPPHARYCSQCGREL